jgi:hypothetical protein
MPQTEQQKIRSRLRGYERKLQQEKKKYGYCSDGGGRRYHIAPHYMLLGDNEGALTAFVSFDEEFDDDAGTPDFWLCYSLALHRADNEVGAAKRLRQAMMSNLYLLPHLIGDPIAALDIWHGSSYAEPGYINHIAEHYLQLWTDEEKEWASGLYHSPGFRTARERYVEISKLLKTVPRGPERSRLVAEMSDLKYG